MSFKTVIMQYVVLTAVMACSHSSSSIKQRLVSTVEPNRDACFDPGLAPYNAVPNDGISDRVALQAATSDASDWSVSTGKPATVCLGAGEWNCDRAPAGSYNRFACVSVHQGNVTFSGVGLATTLALAGDQHQGDIMLISFDPGVTGGGVTSLTTDSSGARNTSEQTHMIGTSGVCNGSTCLPIRNLHFSQVVCNNPPKPDGSRTGDCFRILGNTPPSAAVEATVDASAVLATPGTGVYGVVVENNLIRSCGRSGIQPQRGVHDMIIRGNEFYCDQPVHGEATGGSQEGENSNIEITDNTMHGADPNGVPYQSDVDIALSGTFSPYTGIHIHHNRLSRGIFLYRTSGAEVDHETITMAPSTGYGVIEVENVCGPLSLHDLVVTRNGADGSVMRFTPHSGGFCKGVTLTNVTINQNTVGEGIHMESVSNSTISNNELNWSINAPQFSAIYDRATAADVTGLIIHGNRVKGPVTYMIGLAASPYAFGAGIEVTDNISTGAPFTPRTVTSIGMLCGGAGGFEAIKAYGNSGNSNCLIAP